jgi:galactokinase
MPSTSADREPEPIPARIVESARRAATTFAARFDRSPTLAAFAPGRVNLIGEHTDYNQGFVLPVAIERETVIVADLAARATSTLHLADFHETLNVDLTRSLTAPRGAHGRHILGVARQFQRLGFRLPNLDALVTSTVPIGAGLSSSAAIEVAFATLLQRVVGCDVTARDKARLCQAAEHEFSGTPCGIMDMYISIAASPHHALLIDCRSEQASAIPADFASHGAALLVIDTGVKHDLAAGAYAERRATCEAAAAALGRPSLRGASIEDLNVHGLSHTQRRRALHVISENTRTILAAEALALGDLQRVGELMFASHASLRDLYEVSCPELDALVDAAVAVREQGQGVLGSRMTGAGFGGCTIVLCEAPVLNRVKMELAGAFAARFGREPAMMFPSAAAGGARLLPGPR